MGEQGCEVHSLGYRQAKVGDWCVCLCVCEGGLNVSVWIQTS